jgi:hypothetical protein
MIQSPDKSITGEQPLEREPEMTTITARGSEDHDDFERVQQGIDWLERLEVIKARQDRESAIHETVEYVNRLREALNALVGDDDTEDIAGWHGSDVAVLVDGIRDNGSTDPWTEYLQPTLLES